MSWAFGFSAIHTGGSSVTLSPAGDINAGDLVVAFLMSTEPTITAPSGFTPILNNNVLDERFIIYTRTALESDASAAWTWVNGGGTGERSLAVYLVVIPSATTTSGTPDYDRAAPGTSLALSTTPAVPAKLLLVAWTSAAGGITVPGMDLLDSHDETNNLGGLKHVALFAKDVAAGTHNVAPSAASGTFVAQLVAVV